VAHNKLLTVEEFDVRLRRSGGELDTAAAATADDAADDDAGDGGVAAIASVTAPTVAFVGRGKGNDQVSMFSCSLHRVTSFLSFPHGLFMHVRNVRSSVINIFVVTSLHYWCILHYTPIVCYFYQ
jgi:hypothetical protein